MIKQELDINKRQLFYPIIIMGEIVYKDVIELQHDMFKSKYFKTILSRLRTAIIYRQFEEDMLPKDFPFSYHLRTVNGFGFSIPEFRFGNIILHINHALSTDTLPSQSKYKRLYALNNSFFDRQKMLNIKDVNKGIVLVDNPPCKDAPYYAIITFGGKDKLDFIDLIVPSSDYKDISFRLDLKKEYEKIQINSDNNEIKKKRIKLRDDIIKRIREETI